MIEAKRYTREQRKEWDDFVRNSKNGIFLFYRNYMEYHSDRFRDFSLLFLQNGLQPVALLPANIVGDVVYSHAGLTFGGLICGYSMTTNLMLEISRILVEYLKSMSVKNLVYKAIPHIYHSVPAEEDLYALFRYDAKLLKREVTSAIPMPAERFHKNRNWAIKKAERNHVIVEKSDDLEQFMSILTRMLVARHELKPVHTYEEMNRLASTFPDNIKLFAAYKGDVMLAGVIVYESSNVAHAQYSANTEEGMKMGALDAVYGHLVNDYYREKRYFDFGISTEGGGRHLNIGLIRYKEAFKARAVMQDTYELKI